MKVLCTLRGTGKTDHEQNGLDLSFASFAGSQGKMVQLTQGFGGAAAMRSLDVDEPGYIQLTIKDAYEVLGVLAEWIKEETGNKAEQLQRKIDDNEALKKTIFKDAVECQHFIDDLKILEIPISLLGT